MDLPITETRFDTFDEAVLRAAERVQSLGEKVNVKYGDSTWRIETVGQPAEAPAEAAPVRSFPTVPVLAGALVGLCVTSLAAWWTYRGWKARKAAAEVALAKPQTMPRPVPATAAA